MPTITDDIAPMITIDGIPCENVHQDEIDSRVFYFTPPESPTEGVGRFDFEFSGITVPDHPMPASGAPLLLPHFVEYTADASDGTKGIMDSKLVSWDEARTFVDGAAEQDPMPANEGGRVCPAVSVV